MDHGVVLARVEPIEDPLEVLRRLVDGGMPTPVAREEIDSDPAEHFPPLVEHLVRSGMLKQGRSTRTRVDEWQYLVASQNRVDVLRGRQLDIREDPVCEAHWFAHAQPSPQARPYRIVFDGPPGPESGRFVEVEDCETGASISIGRWEEAPDGLWYLVVDPGAPTDEDTAAAHAAEPDEPPTAPPEPPTPAEAPEEPAQELDPKRVPCLCGEHEHDGRSLPLRECPSCGRRLRTVVAPGITPSFTEPT